MPKNTFENKPLEGEVVEEKTNDGKSNEETAVLNRAKAKEIAYDSREKQREATHEEPPEEPREATRGIIAREANRALKENRPNIFIGTLNLAGAPLKAVTEPLKEHYQKKYHGQYKHAKKIFALDLFLVLVAITLGIAAFLLFFLTPQKNYLDISISNADQIKIGETREFQITLANNSGQVLENLKVYFEFPKNFLIKNAPQNFNQQDASVSFGYLPEKNFAELTFLGQIWGALNERERISARSVFSIKEKINEQVSFLQIPMDKTVLKTDWSLPDKVLAGETFDININYENDSSETLARAVIAPTLPTDFLITAANPDITDGYFALKNILPRAKGQIKITGLIKTVPKNTSNYAVTLETFLEYNEKQYRQKSFLKNLEIAPNGTELSFSVTGHENFFKPGEEAEVNVKLKNYSSYDMKDIVLTLPLPPYIIKDKTAKIIIDKKQLPALALLKRGEALEANMKFFLTDDSEAIGSLPKNFSLEIRPEAAFVFAGEQEKVLRSFAPSQQFKISTILKLHAEARYFTDEGDQLGRGPLPPKVGQTTKYWISWRITDFPNAVKNVVIKARLPAGVAWTNRANVSEGEPVKYDAISRTVSWKSDFIEATEGNSCPCVSIGFEVGLTPDENAAGSAPTLLNNLSIAATDIYTGELVEERAENLTTNLKNDPYVKGNGEVAR